MSNDKEVEEDRGGEEESGKHSFELARLTNRISSIAAFTFFSK